MIIEWGSALLAAGKTSDAWHREARTATIDTVETNLFYRKVVLNWVLEKTQVTDSSDLPYGSRVESLFFLFADATPTILTRHSVKTTMVNTYVLTLLLVLTSFLGWSQQFDQLTRSNVAMTDFTDRMENSDLNWSDVVDSIQRYNGYPQIGQKGREYIYYFDDTLTLQQVPIRIYIPNNYDHLRPNEVAVYFRGAEKLSSWEQVDTTLHKYIPRDSFEYSGGPIVKYLIESDDKIVIRPIPDGKHHFCFAVNCDRPSTVSIGPSIANRAIQYVKRFLNIDDDNVSVWGHSDGADATYLMGTLSPTNYKSLSIYNGMLAQIFGQTYIGNLTNRPTYIVHSNQDNLRKVRITRLQVQLLDSIGHSNYVYKEYGGYNHDDDHLGIDIPAGADYIDRLKRNPYPKAISWESDTTLYGSVDWLSIDSLTFNFKQADWQKELNVSNQFVWKEEAINEPYYQFPKKYGKIMASYDNNIFDIKTSNIGTFILKLFPENINYDRPIKIIVNGETVYDQIVVIDPKFMIKNFKENYDRSQIWVKEININVNNELNQKD